MFTPVPRTQLPLQLSLTLHFTTQQFPFFTLSHTYSSLGFDPAPCKMRQYLLCSYQTPHHKADAGRAGPTSDLGSHCFPLPSSSYSADIRYSHVCSGLLKGHFPPLICSNLGLWWDESVSSLGVDPACACGHGLESLCPATLPGCGPGLRCSQRFPGRS